MMRVGSVLFLLLVFCMFSLTTFSQTAQQPLIVKMKVIYVYPTTLDEDDSHGYRLVDYQVIKVCSGTLKIGKYRVAHIVASTKGLKPGDVVFNKLRDPVEYRQMIEELKADGIDTSGYLAPDFIFAGRQKSCSISNSPFHGFSRRRSLSGRCKGRPIS